VTGGSGGTKVLLAAILLAVLVVAYLPALRGGFLWDDEIYITANPLLTAPGGLADIWLSPEKSPQYYPVTFTSFWIEHRLWGGDPAGYHTINLLLHALSALLLWRLLALLAIPGAPLAAALFALHPLQVESVAWVTERKNVLSGLLYLLSAFAFLRFAGFGGAIRNRGRWYAAALALFALALLGKSVTATLPATLLILLSIGYRRPLRPLLAPLAPLFAIGAAAGLHTAWLERTHVGAMGAAWDFSLPERILIAGRVLWFYLGKLLWPDNLSFVYTRWTVDASLIAQWLFPAAFLLLVLLLWRARRHIGPLPAAAALAYAVALAPVLGFVNVYPMLFSFVADHFAYLATIPALAAVAALLATLTSTLNARLRLAAACLLLLPLPLLTWSQARDYRDAETLWRATIHRNPDAWLAHNNLGVLLRDRGELPEAERHFREALRVNPKDAKGWYNLGLTYALGGRHEEALDFFSRAVRAKPPNVSARLHAVSSLVQLSRIEEAAALLGDTVVLVPGSVEARAGLGVTLAMLGRAEEGIEHLNEALRLDPGNADVRFNLATTLAGTGRLSEAEAMFRENLALNGRHLPSWNNLGALLAGEGRRDEAREAFLEALRLDPDNVDAAGYLSRITAEGER
jgi:tetratricopeptide (TPR) repeat protein